MNTKTIHYCWFGGKMLSSDAKKCIKSWEKFFPSYEIKEWNENNFDINCCDYVKEAYHAKKWAFVSDYARFWILFHEGGIYFDTDVEVIKNMDQIIENGACMGCETFDKCAPGLGIGADPGLDLYKEILDYYNGIHFICEKEGMQTVVDHITRILKKHGWIGDGKIQKIEDIYIYPPEYFCPMDYRTGVLNITQNTYSIHWYAASWQSAYDRFKTKLKYILGPKMTNIIIKGKNVLRRQKDGSQD